MNHHSDFSAFRSLSADLERKKVHYNVRVFNNSRVYISVYPRPYIYFIYIYGHGAESIDLGRHAMEMAFTGNGRES
jgi:hypothetical protein